MFRFWPTAEVFVEAQHFRSLDRKVPAPAGTTPLARKFDEVSDAVPNERAVDNKAVVRAYTETRHAVGSWHCEAAGETVVAGGRRIAITRLGRERRPERGTLRSAHVSS
jgi:hypothetical protein